MGELTLNKPMYPLSNPNDIMKNLVAQKEVTKEPKTIPQEEPKRQPNNHK